MKIVQSKLQTQGSQLMWSRDVAVQTSRERRNTKMDENKSVMVKFIKVKRLFNVFLLPCDCCRFVLFFLLLHINYKAKGFQLRNMIIKSPFVNIYINNSFNLPPKF